MGVPEPEDESPYKIDLGKFANKLKALYSHWRKHENGLWRSADFLAISSPPDDITNFRSSTFISWLLGYKFPETTMIFGGKHVYILCNQTNASLLETVKGCAKDAVDVDVVIHVKLEGEDGKAVCRSMFESKSESCEALIVVGCIEKEIEGSILNNWAEKFQLFDVTNGLIDLLSLKDPNDTCFTNKKGYLTSHAMLLFSVPSLRQAIHFGKESKEKVVLRNPTVKVKVNTHSVDVYSPPIFESGGKSNLMDFSADDFLFYESSNVIICAIGSRYSNNYCYVARTFIVNPDKFLTYAYAELCIAFGVAMKACSLGKGIGDIILAAHDEVDPELAPHLTMTVSTCFGQELHVLGPPTKVEEMRNISKKFKAGVAYNISLGFQNLTATDKSHTFSLLLGDTVVIGNNGLEVISGASSKIVSKVFCYSDHTYGTPNIDYSGDGKSEEDFLRKIQDKIALQKNKETPKRTAREDSFAVYNWDNLKMSNEHIGSRFNNFCSNVARTFFIDVNSVRSRAYMSLCKAHEAAINSVKPGNKMCAIYNAAVGVVASELVPNLTKTAGTCIGFEFGEQGLALDLNNDHVIKAGMVFDIVLGFENLLSEVDKHKSQIFSLLLEDRVVATNSGCEVITQLSSSNVEKVAYSFSIAEEKLELKVEMNILKVVPKQKIEESVRQINVSADEIPIKSNLPRSLIQKIKFNLKRKAVLLPIDGSLVPFDITTVKRVSNVRGPNDECYLRFILNVPLDDDANSLKSKGAMYEKEVSFYSQYTDDIYEVLDKIKKFRSDVAKESKRAERAMWVPEKQKLSRDSFNPIRLSGLRINVNPPFGSEPTWDMIGALEAHVDRFRYSTSRQGKRVDIMYANIKHAFFQPAETETEITLLHLHLHKYIKVGKKKTRDVQFYMKVVQRLGDGTPSSSQHRDETEELKKEREKMNMDFQNFVNDLEVHHSEFKEFNLEFELPLRDLGFNGVIAPYGEEAFIVPTLSCLVELLKIPSFFVITLSDIEIVSLETIGIERGDMEQNDFDMVIVFKDFKRDVSRINSIPSTFLNGVKDWLTNADIKYHVIGGNRNRNWRAILHAFSDDALVFREVGGWDFLKQETKYELPIEPESSYTDCMSDSQDSQDSQDFDDEARTLFDLGESIRTRLTLS